MKEMILLWLCYGDLTAGLDPVPLESVTGSVADQMSTGPSSGTADKPSLRSSSSHVLLSTSKQCQVAAG
jgi:hypothetical protein